MAVHSSMVVGPVPAPVEGPSGVHRRCIGVYLYEYADARGQGPNADHHTPGAGELFIVHS